MAPARLVGRLRPGVLAAASADAAALRALPKVAVAVGLPLLVVILAGLVSVTHATSTIGHVSPQIDWLRFQIDDVFTESPLFLVAAVAIGAFSPALGVFLVAVFGVMDVAAAAWAGELLGVHRVDDPAFTLLASLAGRLVAIWLLWLLAVEIPIFGRLLGLSWRRLAGNRFAVATLTGLATGAFTWTWTQATIVLVRPVFTWSPLAQGSVRLEAIQPVQEGGLVFAVVGGLVAAAIALARGPGGLLYAPLGRPAQPAPRGSLGTVGQVVRRVVVAALLTVLLGGLITAPLEAVALFATLAGARPLARFVADRTALGAIVRALPPIARYAVAAALMFVVAQVVIGPLYGLASTDPGLVPEFFSLVVAVAIGIILVELLTTPAAQSRSRTTAAPSAAVIVVLGSVLVLLAFAAPVTVLADNCASLRDCFMDILAAALFAMSVPFVLAANHFDPPDGRRPKGHWHGPRQKQDWSDFPDLSKMDDFARPDMRGKNMEGRKPTKPPPPPRDEDRPAGPPRDEPPQL